jgi:N-acetylglucosamine-6-phosphate deacetylase
MATHLFNAMSPFSHRAPGAIGAALTEPRITVGLIADGVHSHPLSLRLAVAAKGPERIALVSDMMAAAGMGPGSYTLAGQAVRVDASSARLADGTLAGSILTMDQAVRNMVAWTGNSPATALRMASEVPARVLGLSEFGRIVAGAFADLVLLDETLAPTATIVAGRIVWRRADPPLRSHVGIHAST